ncbi:hypothetical protein V6N13_113837 [Hibiscus sabdariffa]
MRAAGDVVLLLFVTEEEHKSILDRSNLDKWFVKVLPWSPDNIFDSRSAWVSVCGVPFERSRMLIETKQMERIEETIEVDCNGKLILIWVQEVEMIHSNDIMCQCQCGMVDESSESADIMEEGCDARLVAPAVVSTARTVQEQEDMGDTNKEVLGRVADEVTGMVRREETTITQRMEGLACEGWLGIHSP